ncbi:TetR/AcrR family transcriptional regulator [Micromonosporaceae bacterium Da 78-11]
MASPGSASSGPASPGCAPPDSRRRNAAGTRQLLLDAARRHFARDGYVGSTVRDIAEEAGVNVALINRYFTSKEGLFTACLTDAVDDLGRTVTDDMPLDQVPLTIARRLTGSDVGEYPSRLLLLLRTSGDESAERIRLDVLRSFAERLAAAAGRRPGDPDGDQVLLNAQIVLAASFGMVLLRASTALEPLTSAGERDLVGPLQRLVHALLPTKHQP